MTPQELEALWTEARESIETMPSTSSPRVALQWLDMAMDGLGDARAIIEAITPDRTDAEGDAFLTKVRDTLTRLRTAMGDGQAMTGTTTMVAPPLYRRAAARAHGADEGDK